MDVIVAIEARERPRSDIEAFLRADGKMEITHAQYKRLQDIEYAKPIGMEPADDTIPEDSIEVVVVR